MKLILLYPKIQAGMFLTLSIIGMLTMCILVEAISPNNGYFESPETFANYDGLIPYSWYLYISNTVYDGGNIQNWLISYVYLFGILLLILLMIMLYRIPVLFILFAILVICKIIFDWVLIFNID